MTADARTTPRLLRVPILVALLALAAYNVDCWRHALGNGEPSFLRFFATWQMFTLKDPTHYEVIGEAEVNGEWKPIDLEALFPTRWESGPRYARSSFWKSQQTMRVFAAATCGRHPDHPTKVRFHVDRWPKTLGKLEQPKRKLKQEDLLEWPCDRKVSLPKGRLL